MSLHFHAGARMNKERPGELNQKIKRLRVSRDGLKLNNREKARNNKKLRDRNEELSENRDQWKARSKELSRQKEDLEQQIQTAREETERERMRADEERERADSAPAMPTNQRGESPRHRRSSNYVTESNCIDAKRCGEQLDVKGQAVG
jgi:DNA repair exonuclease SbcCD ATPase subunit